ncbi:hypothetical protein AB0J83_12345 [Actinoplanes sp. NPDC049596]|uniref:hypothetical protein n=1 Tax=unclassified Actinoplanes TaxID=2626549 RepID=UPI00341FD24C
MELHRDTGKMLRTAIFLTAFGALGVALPTLIGLIGYEFRLGPWLIYILGGIVLLGGLINLYSVLRRPFRLAVEGTVLIVRSGGLKADIPWESLDAITIERAHFLDPPAAPHVIVWPAPGVNLGSSSTYRRKNDDRTGYLIIQTDDLREPYPEVAAFFHRFAGHKFTVPA